MMILESVGVAPIVEKNMKNRLRWFEYVGKILVNFVIKRVGQMERSQRTRE